MSDSGYPHCILELYRSEVLGEAVFLALFQHAKTQGDAYKFATLLQLETETKARLRPFLMQHGLPLIEEDFSDAAIGAVADYEKGGWARFVTGTLNAVSYFLPRFEEIERLGPAGDFEILHSMVVHERAIQRFLEAEQDGQSNGSLDEIIGLLHFPIGKG